ncbi:MAG: hypothetical protein IPL08_02400 [Saprospiraceae bacterium]|nr:hypothetical protein [Saprospiraceae bacterium]
MKYIVLILISLISIEIKAQRDYTRAEMIGYNVGLNALNAGISRIINKKPREKIKDVFLDGLWKGAIGGAINYTSKELVLQIHESQKPDLFWTSRLVNTLGNSVTYNAANNDGIFDYIYFDFGFNRLKFSTTKFKVEYKIMPISILLMLATAKDGNFNIKRSLTTLTPYFEPKSNYIDGSYSRSNNILIQNNEFIGHELIHTYSHYEFMVVNTFVQKKRNYKNNEKLSFLKKVNKYIYWDILNRLVTRSLYAVEGDITPQKYDNFFEYEANFFSDRLK